MTKRNVIYAGLLVFVTIGLIIDNIFELTKTPPYTLNDVIQAIGILILVLWWQIADAHERGIRLSGFSKVMTILFAPIGSAIYLFQSRTWKSAFLAFLGFWGGILVVAYVTIFLMEKFDS